MTRYRLRPLLGPLAQPQAGRALRLDASSPVARPSAMLLVIALITMLFGVAFSTFLPSQSAQAANTGCGYANTSANNGQNARTICWFDFTNFNETVARTTAGQPTTITLEGGYVATFAIKVRNVSGTPPLSIEVRQTPLETRFAFGTDAYRGVPGNNALYSRFANGVVQAGVLTFDNIQVRDPSGALVTGFSFVAADVEDNVSGESFVWNSDKPLDRLETLAPNGQWGCKNPVGIGTTQISCAGTGAGATTIAGGKSTALLVSAAAPSTFSTTWRTAARSGIGVGIQTAKVTLNKTVASRVGTNDSFDLRVTSPEGSALGSATTGTTNTATTGEVTVLPRTDGRQFTLSEVATAGGTTNLSFYNQAWVCVNAATGSTTTLPGAASGTSAAISPQIGDDIRCTITNTAKPASVSLVKRAGTPVDVNGDGLVDAGDTIQYSFDVQNTGPLPLNSISVADAKAGAVTCPTTTLAPNASVTCQAAAVYTITAADVSAGSVVNTATASGTPPGSTTPVKSPPSSTTTVTTAPAPSLTVDKSASPDNAASFTVGRQITYSFVVKNTGNVPLNDVKVTEESFTGSGTMSNAVCPSTSLAVGASETCTASYTVTQADVDKGSLTNTAKSTGTPPGGTPVNSPPDTVVVPAPNSPSISVVKSADPTSITAAGAAIRYSFTATNTGNVTLTNVSITEGAFSGSGTLSAVTCPAGAASLAPGASVVCTADYTATQADVDAGRITNTATASGRPPTGNPVTSDPSSAVVTAQANPSLAVVKSADPSSIAKAGDAVAYSFVVTNTGNVTMTDVTVAETAFSGTGTAPAVTCPAGAASLAPGASVTCTASYVATQADVDAGSITNTATSTGTPPDGTPVTSPPSSAVVTANPAPGLTMVKSADPAQAGKVGDTITYSFVFTNTGNVTMTNITVNEGEFTGTGTLGEVSYPTRTLAPGESTTATASYVLTQADVDAGKVTNTATGSGTPPTGPSTDTPPSTSTVTIDPNPSLAVVKSADPSSIAKAGDAVAYSFVVTNTGNVTMTDVTVAETAFSGTGTAPAVTCPAGAASLAPGASVTCTASYVATQADVDAGSITNTATSTGTPPDGTPVTSPPSSAVVTANPAPGLTMVKSADPAQAGKVGDTITYSFVFTNTGNVTMTNITVNEGEVHGDRHVG
ncbi:DUF7507 domain-containing protein [Agreia bicolorata]|uniref:DUF7507 domain-containing protein n=1 Tax=Agreia bicolorata TaxID=110935 RepID=UPI0009FC493B